MSEPAVRRRRTADESNGEPGRNRTYNQQIKSLLLCQLSYGPTLGVVAQCFGLHDWHVWLAL